MITKDLLDRAYLIESLIEPFHCNVRCADLAFVWGCYDLTFTSDYNTLIIVHQGRSKIVTGHEYTRYLTRVAMLLDAEALEAPAHGQ